MGSFRLVAKEAATNATPGTAVIGSGVPTIKATPAFFIAELGEPGFESPVRCFATGFVSMLDAALPLASCSLVRESATERTILFSSIPCHCSMKPALRVTVKGGWWFGKLITLAISSPGVPKLLKDMEISSRLKDLKGWKREGKFIAKTFEFDHFMDAIDFVNEVAEAAERQEHHPDISI